MKKTREIYNILAFGSNTDLDDLNRYCLGKGKTEVSLRFCEKVKIPDNKLVFDKYAGSRNGGVLNIRSETGHVVEALLLKTDKEGLNMLRKKEGARIPGHYEEKKIIAIRNDGSVIRATTFIYPFKETNKFVRPSPEYLEICKKGYHDFDLDLIPLLAAANNEPAIPLSGLLAYGTLMREQPLFSIVKKHGVGCALLAQCFGSLSTNGSYPALDLKGAGFSWGDFILSEDIVSLLPHTDKIEGFRGYDQDNHHYRRTCVDVDIGGISPRLAWVYVQDTPSKLPVPSNDWRDFRSVKQKFYSSLIAEHKQQNPNLGREISAYINRYNPHKTDPDVLSSSMMQSILLEGTCLTEKRLAQHSNFWTACVKNKCQNMKGLTNA